MFGITAQIPGSWLVYPQQNRERLSWATGSLNFEECLEPMKASSLGIQWEAKETTEQEFLDSYPKYIEQSYSQKMKKKTQFVLTDNRILHLENGKNVCLLCCEYRASTSMLDKSKFTKISVMNTAFYCEHTQRIIAATIVARPARMNDLEDIYRGILLGIQSA